MELYLPFKVSDLYSGTLHLFSCEIGFDLKADKHFHVVESASKILENKHVKLQRTVLMGFCPLSECFLIYCPLVFDCDQTLTRDVISFILVFKILDIL